MANTVNYKDVLKSMTKTWILCYGMITALVVSGYWVSPVLRPYVGLLLIGIIICFGNHNLSKTTMHCSMVTHYSIYTLLFSGLTMLLISLLRTNYVLLHFPDLAYFEKTYNNAFIVYPIATVVFFISMYRRTKTKYCRACTMIANASISESLRRNVLHHEAKFQLRFSFVVSMLLTVEAYVFYFVYYSKYDDGHLQSPDIFFLYVIPAIVYVICLVYLLVRYSTLEFEIPLKMAQYTNSRSSRIRYMVVWRDQLLLKDLVDDKAHGSYWDTPADVPICFQNTLSEHQAFVEFRKFSGLEDFKLKWLYGTNFQEQNVFHYAVFIDDEVEEAKGKMSGEWMMLREVSSLLKKGHISRPFAAELHRVFTITMAWKTYDREGKRLYPIKNYRPTFRLRDFHKWDVDYEDMHLMSIAENNEDKPFFHLRKFWRRYINGFDKRWDKR